MTCQRPIQPPNRSRQGHSLSPKRLGRDALIAVVTLFYAVMLLAAWRPQFFSAETLSDGLDSGWAFALNAFHAKGFQHGRDVVFTYGPLGFLEPRFYHPDTYIALLLRSAAFAVVVWYALWSYGRSVIQNVWARGVWLVILTTLAGITVRATEPEFFLCALLLLIHFHRSPGTRANAVWWLLIASLAL